MRLLVTAVLCAPLLGCGRFGFEESSCPGNLIGNAPYAAGTGTPDDPIQVCSPDQLTAFAERPADHGSSLVLMTDLDLANIPFPGIGTFAEPFTGYLDGNGYTISNVEVTASGDQPAGFINVAHHAHIENLRLANVKVAGTNDLGAIVGYCESSLIRGATVTAVEIGGADSVGGLVGAAYDCQFIRASVTGRVTGTTESIGGIVGMSESSAFLAIDSTVGVDAPLATAVGGAVGMDAYSPTILQHVTVAAEIVGDTDVGGLVGANNDGALVHRSRFDGTVRGNTAVGGIVGGNYDVPFNVYSTSSTGTVIGNTGVGGFSGYFYYRAEFYDSYFTGTLSGVGAAQTSFGGFFGDVYYYGWVERSYVDVTIDSTASSAGGFVGRIAYWSGASAIYDIARSVSAARITGSSPTATISPYVGQNLDPNPLVGAGSHYWSGGTCTNLAGGGCGTGGAPIADLAQLQNPGVPLEGWDFTDVWQAQSGGFPTLRLEQTSAPVLTQDCPRHAIAGLPYVCALIVTDDDPNEIRIATLGRPNACGWLSSSVLRLYGTPTETGSCTTTYSVTDGAYATPDASLTIDIHAGVVMTPASPSGIHHYFGSQTVGSTLTQTFTLTNREAVAVTDLAITGLPSASFAFVGGAYPGTSGTCSSTLAPGATCTVVIASTPTMLGTVSSPLALQFSAARGPAVYAFTLEARGI